MSDENQNVQIDGFESAATAQGAIINDEQVNTLPELDDIEAVLQEEALLDRYKGRKGADLVRELAKSYKNAEGFLKTLKDENKEYRENLAQAIAAIQRQQQPQPQQQQTQQFANDEERLAYEFAQKYIIPQLSAPIQQMQQQQQLQVAVDSAMNYGHRKAYADPEFAKAWSGGDIEKVVVDYGLPPNPKSIDLAWKILRGDRLESNNIEQQALVDSSKQKLADEKARAALATSSSRQSNVNSQEAQLAALQEEASKMTPDQFAAHLQKKYKIGIG